MEAELTDHPANFADALLDGLKALGMARLVAMAAVAAGTFGLFILLAMRPASSPMALLYGDLDLREAAQIADQLEQAHIPHQVAANGGAISVPPGQVAQARLLLAKSGLPSGGSVGYEIFDRGDALTTTEAQQQINETRALEGELTRSIVMIAGVRAARVHLVLPKREPFSRNQQESQASVLLTMRGGMRMDPEGTQAILNLVAAAVPGLHPDHIAVIDSHGEVLARAGQPADGSDGMTADDLRRTTELRLSRAVEDMLNRSLGPDHVRAEAAVDMDYDRSNQTEERYDPDGQVLRSQQTVSDATKSREANSSVSVQNNLPNANAGANPAGSQANRQEETNNYEINRTVSTLVHSQPKIRRISMAVMVDGQTTIGADGKPAWHPLPSADLDHITELVRSTIGYDEKRGDHVEVVSMHFLAEPENAAPAAQGMVAQMFGRPDMMHLAETGLLGMLGLAALLLVGRPMALRLAAPLAAGTAAGMATGVLPHMRGNSGGDVAAGDLLALPAPHDVPLLADDSLVQVGNIEGQMRASSIRRLTSLVDTHPEEAIAIVRGWMAQAGGG